MFSDVSHLVDYWVKSAFWDHNPYERYFVQSVILIPEWAIYELTLGVLNP